MLEFIFFIFFMLGLSILLKEKKENYDDTIIYDFNKPKDKFDDFNDDPLKRKGDLFEKHIGSKFETQDDLVIYNGLIRGYEDKGVDLIVISLKYRIINLIQCKNWTNMTMTKTHIEKIYSKLNNYDLDFYNLDIATIQEHLINKKDSILLSFILDDSKNYKIYKTLYASSDKVVDNSMGQSLQMVKNNIFKYKDMKIVFYEL